jgi:hypothetical protein
MPQDQRDRIKDDVATAMDRIEASRRARRVVFLSGLAEGADRLAAFAALGRGWRLRAILAFHRSRFEEDFPAPFAIGEFRALLGASQDVEEPRKGAHRGRPPEEGYHAVGQRLLALSDVLIAIWDGESSGGKGGTVEVIEEARGRGIPVVWVHASKAREPQWLAPLRRRRPQSTRLVASGRRASEVRIRSPQAPSSSSSVAASLTSSVSKPSVKEP